MEEKIKKDIGSVAISTRIDAETNQLLTQAAKSSRRSKHNEMAVRLKDHLRRFPTKEI